METTDPNLLYTISPQEDPNCITLAMECVLTVGTFQSTRGWQHFRYEFDEETSGTYLLFCGVKDRIDRGWKSYLALDNFRICYGDSGPGDLNFDCAVDFKDFELLSKAWLADCADPNVLNDPNVPCYPFLYDTEVPENIVDLEEMLWVGDTWLDRRDQPDSP